MTSSLTPNWLHSHSITLLYFDPDSYGALSTPAPGYEVVTGHIQLASHVVRTAQETELQSAGYVYLPNTVASKVNAYTRVQYGSDEWGIINISKYNMGGSTISYVRADLI